MHASGPWAFHALQSKFQRNALKEINELLTQLFARLSAIAEVVIVSAQWESGHNSNLLAGRNFSPRRFHGRVIPHGITTAS